MTSSRPNVPLDIVEELTKDAAAVGFTSPRTNARLSRWTYLKKLLALGRQYKDVLRAN